MADHARGTRHLLAIRSDGGLGEEVASLLNGEGMLGLWEVSPREWRAYFPEPRSEIAEKLAAALPGARCSWEEEPEVDWAARYQASLHPLPAGRRFAILPSPDLENPWPGRMPLLLVPGMAFGTGEHFTTSSCLSMIEDVASDLGRVLDVGCGTGVLAIAARKLGATFVAACDVDPIACEVAAKSAAANGALFHLVVGSTSAVRGSFDTIVANILAETLEELLPDLSRLLAPGGRLIGSGIAANRALSLLKCALGEGFHVHRLRTDGEWWTILWTRNSVVPKESASE